MAYLEKEDIKTIQYEEDPYEEIKQVRWGFQSKTRDMAEGKIDVSGKKKMSEKQRKKKEAKYMHPSKRPGIARYIPKQINVHPTMARVLGVPEGWRETGVTSMFGRKDETPKPKDFMGFDMKIGKDGKRRLF